MRFSYRPVAASAAAIALAGVTSLPRERGYAPTGELIQAHLGPERAELEDARRLSNSTIGYGNRGPRSVERRSGVSSAC